MTLTDDEMETRLRRTFAAVVDAPLDGPAPAVAGRRRRPLATAVVALAAVVVAVVGVVLLDQEEPVTTVANQPDDSRNLDDYRPDPAEAALLFRAQQRLIARCMEAAGQPYPELPPSGDELDPDWSRLGRTDPQRAERQGYVLPEPGAGGKHPVQDSLATQQQRDAWSLALTGEPYSGEGGPTGPSVPIVDPVTGQEGGGQSAGGCFGEMQRKLYVDQSRHTSLESWVGNHVGNDVEGRVVEDARFKAAIRSWSSCMKGAGYDYDDPFGPVNEFNAPPPVQRPTPRELAVARADIGCKDDTGLVRTYRELHSEYGAVAVATYRPLLEEYRQIVDRALATATTVL